MKLLIPLVVLSVLSILFPPASFWEDNILVFEYSTGTLQTVEAGIEDQRVYLPLSFLVSALEFEAKNLTPQLIGMCREDLCIPLSLKVHGGKHYVSTFDLFKALSSHWIWDDETRQLFLKLKARHSRSWTAGETVDFVLPNLNGRLIRLSGFRGKKVVLFTWASWSLCREQLLDWQRFYAQNQAEEFELIAVAADIQGAEKVRPWLQKAGATYTALIDSSNELSQQFFFNNLPLTLLINEAGHIVHRAQATNINQKDDQQKIMQWIKTGTVEVQTVSKSHGFSGPDSELRFQAAALHLSHGDTKAAVGLLKKALTFDPKNWLIRKQIWAIEHPDRFYSGTIDSEWQKRRLELERLSPLLIDQLRSRSRL